MNSQSKREDVRRDDEPKEQPGPAQVHWNSVSLRRDLAAEPSRDEPRRERPD